MGTPVSRRERAAARALRSGVRALQTLPPGLGYAIADAAVPLLVAFTLLHERRVAPRGRGLFRNQRIAFRERWTPVLGARLLLGFARHVARLAVDFGRMPLLDAAEVRRCVELPDFETLLALRAEGRGLLCVSGHLGAWELAGHVSTQLGMPVTVLARPQASAALERQIRALRTSGGQGVRTKWGALWPAVRALRRGEVIGLLADEDSPARPVFAPFLGTLAATSPVAAFLQRVTGAPIAVVSCHRTGRGRFCLRTWRVIRAAPTRSRDTDLQAVTEEINAALSEAILAHPAQWLWGSRRFATRPPGERSGDDGLPPRAPAPVLG